MKIATPKQKALKINHRTTKKAPAKVKKVTQRRALSTGSFNSNDKSFSQTQFATERKVAFKKQSRLDRDEFHSSASDNQEDYYHQSVTSTGEKKFRTAHPTSKEQQRPGSYASFGGAPTSTVNNDILRSSLHKSVVLDKDTAYVEYSAVASIPANDNRKPVNQDIKSTAAQEQVNTAKTHNTNDASIAKQYGDKFDQQSHASTHRVVDNPSHKNKRQSTSASASFSATKAQRYQQQTTAGQKNIFEDPRVFRSFNILGDAEFGWKSEPINQDLYQTMEEYEQAQEFLKQKKCLDRNTITGNVTLGDVLVFNPEVLKVLPEVQQEKQNIFHNKAELTHKIESEAQYDSSENIFHDKRFFRSFNILGDGEVGMWKKEPIHEDLYQTMEEYEQARAFLKSKKHNQNNQQFFHTPGDEKY